LSLKALKYLQDLPPIDSSKTDEGSFKAKDPRRRRYGLLWIMMGSATSSFSGLGATDQQPFFSVLSNFL
jgi:hypothetical protein